MSTISGTGGMMASVGAGGTGGEKTWADIAFDTATTEISNPGELVVKASHTCTGSNRILLAIVGDYSGMNSVTGVTYAGTAMKQWGSAEGYNSLTAPTNYAYLYYLINPPSGPNDIIATRTGSLSNIALVAASYTGVSQTTFPDAWTSLAHDDNSSPKQSLTCISDKSWFVLGGASQREYSAGEGSTLRSVPNFDIAWFDSNGALPASTNYGMTVNISGLPPARVGAEFMVSLAPALLSGP